MHKSCSHPCCKAFSPLVCLIFDVVARLGSDCIRTDIFELQDTLRYYFGHHLAAPRKQIRVFNLDRKMKVALFSKAKNAERFLVLCLKTILSECASG